MEKKAFQQLLRKYREGHCTPEEQAFVEAWYTAMESQQDVPMEVPEKMSVKQRSWNRVQMHMQPPQRVPVRRLQPVYAWAIAAAVLLTLVSVIYLFVKPGAPDAYLAANVSVMKEITNDTDKEMEVLLDDGSRVVLQLDSRVSFQAPLDKSIRAIALEGQAFFSVSRDTLRPFVVTTHEVITRVLGTSFTISAIPGQDTVTVAVKTGRVSVSTRTHSDAVSETILTPNQKVVYHRQHHALARTLVPVPLPVVAAEVVKRMHFEEAPLRDVFAGLEEVYGVDLVFDERTFSSCTLTTSIAGGSLYARLDILCRAVDARYTIEENRIVITGNGCRP